MQGREILKIKAFAVLRCGRNEIRLRVSVAEGLHHPVAVFLGSLKRVIKRFYPKKNLCLFLLSFWYFSDYLFALLILNLSRSWIRSSQEFQIT